MFRPFTLIAALLFAGSPAFSKTYLGPWGGNGGSDFQAICPNGEVLVGLAVQVNNALRVIAPICAAGVSPFEVDQTSVHVYEVVFGTVQAPGRYMRCPTDRPVIRAMSVWKHPDLHLVDKLHLKCGPISDGAPPISIEERADIEWDGGDFELGSNFGIFLACPYGEVGVGIFGRSGASVDRLGLICDVPVLKKTDYISPSVSADAKDLLEGPKSGLIGGQSDKPGTSAAEGLLAGPQGLGAIPPTPVQILLNISATQKAGFTEVKLSWTGATAANVDIYRNGTRIISTANDGEFIDNVASGAYTYRLCNAGSLSECSADKAVSF